MTLEHAISEAVSNDRLDGLTIYPSGSGWQANARFAGSSGWNCVTDPDPVKALLAALRRGRPSPQPSGVFD